MTLPFYFDFQRIAARKTPEKLRYDLMVKEFGSPMMDNCRTWPAVGECVSQALQLSSGLYAEWRRAIAEELLLRHVAGESMDTAWLETFANDSPFGNELKLQASLNHCGACGVFPMSGTNQPGIGHVWIFRNGGSALPATAGEDYTKILSGGYVPIFVTTHDGQWTGRSWLLAAHLALRAMHALDCTAIRDLPRRWRISGIVGKNQVERVRLGNKLELPGNHVWLIPLENIKDVPPSATGKTIYSAADIDSAWAHLTGRGRQPGGELPWPEDARRLDIFIGGYIHAAVASAIFMTKKSKVRLWTSPNFKDHAEAAALVIHSIRPDLDIATPCMVASDSLINTERQLIKAFNNTMATERILFNITSGNRLMAMAADSIARLYPWIEPIYRDIDAVPYVFTRFDYRQYPHAIGSYRGNAKACRGINANFLFAPPSSKPKSTPKKIAGEFLAQCRSV